MAKGKETIYEKNLLKADLRLKNDRSLFFIQDFLKLFPSGEIFLVGGAVRDIALGVKEVKDYDFVVRGINVSQLEKFLEKRGKVVLVGKNFGVYKFVPKGVEIDEAIDIALPRTEHSLGEGGGYRDFKVQSDPAMKIEEDLARRDFTINAMALKFSAQGRSALGGKVEEIKDPYNGLQDIASKIIRAVGDPKERFKEDYSRMLRALRFAVKLDFKIEEKTFEAISGLISRVNDERKIGKNKERVVPYETIAKEFVKTFYYSPTKAFDLYEESGATIELIPEMLTLKGCPQPRNFHSEGDVWTHTRLALSKLDSKVFKKYFKKEKPRASVVVGLLFHDLGKPITIKTPEKDGTDRIRFSGHDILGAELAKKICRRLKLDSLPENSPLRVDADRLKMVIEKHMLLVQGKVKEMRPGTIEKYFFNPNFPGEELLQLNLADSLATIPEKGKVDLSNFKGILKRINSLKKLVKEKNRLPAPILDGHEIMKHFNLKPGKEIGELINVLREAQLSGDLGKEKSSLESRKKKGLEVLKNHLADKKISGKKV
jgi:poly(A) polymerase